MERKKLTKELKEIKGRLLIFGGVYSNLQALAQMKLIAKQENISASNIICTGDIVAYCAQPEECVQEVKEWGIHCVAGNVEIQLREGLEDCGCNFESGTTCNILSNQWYPFAQKKLSPGAKAWMDTLPDFLCFSYKGKKVQVIHGSINETAEYIYKSTAWDVKKELFEESGSELIIAGHSGLPFIDQKDNCTWLNAGVIGMPANDGTTDVWYTIMDDSSDMLSYEFHRMQYDHELASQLMEINRLPKEYSKTLVTGIWDNCDVLPEVETLAQGTKLTL